MLVTKAPASTDGVDSAASASSGPVTSTRWGDRLSTVNGPDTRTTFLSSYGRSNRVSVSAWRAIAASISSRVMPSWMSGFWAIDFRVTCGTRSYTKPRRTSLAVAGIGLGGAWPVTSASLRIPASESARR